MPFLDQKLAGTVLLSLQHFLFLGVRSKKLGLDLFRRHLFGTPMATGRTGDPAPPLLLSGKIIVQEVHTLSSARDFRFAFWI